MIVHQFAPSSFEFSLFESSLSADFPSPADDYISKRLSLDDLIIHHPNSTFFVKITGDSMKDAGIFEGDIAVIDKSIEAQHHQIVLACVDGEFTIKRYVKIRDKIYLNPENVKYNAIEITVDTNATIEGVVISTIKSHV